MLLYPSESIRTIRDGKSRTSISTCTQLLKSEAILARVWCYLTSTETVGTIRDGIPGRPPRLLHSSWPLKWSVTRLVEVLLYVHRNRRFIRDGCPWRPPRLSHSSWPLCDTASPPNSKHWFTTSFLQEGAGKRRSECARPLHGWLQWSQTVTVARAGKLNTQLAGHWGEKRE